MYYAYGAEWADKRVEPANSRNTSQMCSGCSHIVKKTLSSLSAILLI
ncbi:MAG: zinc ribbon domain-containing protein [Methanolobus sp.]